MKELFEEFVRKHSIPAEDVRPDILNSWQRCIDREVSPGAPDPLVLTEKQLEQRILYSREYIEAMKPVIECVNDLIGASSYVVSFVDRDGFILTIHGKQELKEFLEV